MSNSVKGVVVTKEQPKVGVQLGDLRISGLIANAIAIGGTFELNTLYSVNSLKDAEEVLGITAEYDTTNRVVLHHHIKEFFHEVGLSSGVKLYLYGVSQATTMEGMVDVAGTIGKAMIDGSEGEAFQIGICRNPDSGYSATVVDGLLDEVHDAIPKAQALVDYGYAKMFPTRIVLEGRNFTAPVSAVQDLRDITNVKAPNVSVVVGQDYDYAEKDALFNNYAAVGTFLGTMASADIHVNPGWVDEFNLTDVAAERWEKAGFSNHQPVENFQDDWQLLDTKGYVFPQTYAKVPGYRWNGDPTCTPIEVDVEGNMNEAYQRFGRTMDAVTLTAYGALIGSVKSPQPIDPGSGKLPPVVVADFKEKAEDAIDQDLGDKISGREVVVDKDSNLLPPVEALDMSVTAVPFGSATQINVKLQLKKQL